MSFLVGAVGCEIDLLTCFRRSDRDLDSELGLGRLGLIFLKSASESSDNYFLLSSRIVATLLLGLSRFTKSRL